MDFGALLHFAKKKSDETKEQQQQRDGKFYSTKYSPPKKMTKQSTQLSNNIQKFLQKKEAEEAEKRREKNQKVADLMAKRDEKTKNKIRKMLKMTKSANKSVLNDANGGEGNAVRHETGEGQGDDYGYTSKEANALYEKYLEKVRDVSDNKSFTRSRPQSLSDLSGTKERVKAAINRELQEAASHTRQRRVASDMATSSTAATSSKVDTKSRVACSYTTTRTLYDPEEEKRVEEEKRLADQRNRAKLKRSSQPQPMDFQALLRLAEKKQHEPVVFAQPEKKEPERLLCAKEKREMEERQRRKEERAQQDKMRELAENKPKDNGRIPKLNQSKSTTPTDTAKWPAKPSSSSSSGNRNPGGSTKLASNYKTVAAASVGSKPAAKAERPSTSGSGSSRKMPPPPSRNLNAAANKNSAVHGFPPRDRPAASGSSASTANAKKHKFPSANVKDRRSQANGHKRRICDDDESEYDSELDDFIDNGDCEEDISKHIRNIFGYDKRRYRDQDDDDRSMESSFAQMQREEFISKKLGRQEDLEDMRCTRGEK